MMEAIRDIDNHMVCCVDSTRGLIEHIYQKEMVRISLPVGGEVLFVKGDCFTLIRRISSQSVYVTSEHQQGLGFFGS